MQSYVRERLSHSVPLVVKLVAVKRKFRIKIYRIFNSIVCITFVVVELYTQVFNFYNKLKSVIKIKIKY
ncbi:hypothetical protein BpHYR1_039085 [Brachionus plicatilis]|uniref:Uncharacterized protein n=1 Tax=Brachionus plicatilis TaxID=10195 RepID=A0A3M7RZQ5_BRAPC|nr:hypothetical protein BpHYR1_039085 [Brachionus plicatilis]